MLRRAIRRSGTLDVHGGTLSNTAIGLDIDGTISSDPCFFSSLTTRFRRVGGAIHIVSSRSRCSREETIDELRKWKIGFDVLFLLPSFSEASHQCPHRELDWYAKHCWCKVDYANTNRLRFFVDDDRVVLELFRKYGLGVVAIDPRDPQLVAEIIFRR